MSLKTEYKPGDRVSIVNLYAYNGKATVVRISDPFVGVVFDHSSTFDGVVTLHKQHVSLVESAPKAPRYSQDDIRLIMERAAGSCRCVDYRLRVSLCGSCQAKKQVAEFTTAEWAQAKPYQTFPKDKTVGTLRVNVELAPDSVTDAFIDKVADRVAAKVITELRKSKDEYGRYYWNSAPSRYVTATDKQSIKAALAAGKIVNAPRHSGKTTAILELLRENPGKYVAFYPSSFAEGLARNTYVALFGHYLSDDATDYVCSHQNNGDRLVIADDCPNAVFPNLFASVFTR